jgi:hypothetical protein
MSTPRTNVLSTKVTDEEYAALERAAGAQTLSTWAREVLLRAACGPAADGSVVLAEVLALRSILLNLHFVLVAGTGVTAEQMQQLIERADRNRFTRAAERLAEASAQEAR